MPGKPYTCTGIWIHRIIDIATCTYFCQYLHICCGSSSFLAKRIFKADMNSYRDTCLQTCHISLIFQLLVFITFCITDSFATFVCVFHCSCIPVSLDVRRYTGRIVGRPEHSPLTAWSTIIYGNQVCEARS